jgi:hypothetical protein
MSLALFMKEPEKYDAYNILMKFKEPDTCIFIKEHYNKPKNLNLSIFDSTEILNFEGSIISDDIEHSLMVMNSVCRCELYHIYNPKDKRLMDLIKLSKYKNIIFCLNNIEDLEDLRRKVGQNQIKSVKKIESLEKLIGGINDYKRIRSCQKI